MDLKSSKNMMIDSVEFNCEIKLYVEAYDLDTPKFMIGDRVSLRKNAKETITTGAPFIDWDTTHDEYMSSDTLTVIRKFKYSKTDPWWSLISDGNGSEIYLIDDCLRKSAILAKHMYSPKKINKTI